MDINNFTLLDEIKANQFADLRVKAVGEKWGNEAVNHEAFNGYVVGFGEAENIYKTLLYKYIQYIKQSEGTDNILIHDERYMTDVDFSKSEWDVLKRLAGM